MFTNNRAETINPGKTDNRVIDASKELAELGSIKEGLKADIKEFEKKALHYKGLDEKIEKAEEEVERLTPLVVDLKDKLDELGRVKEELGIAKSNLIEVDNATKEIADGNTKLLEVKAVIEKEIDECKAKLSSAILAYDKQVKLAKDADAEWQLNADKKVSDLHKELEKIEKDIAIAKESAKELESVNAEWMKKNIEAENKYKSLEVGLEVITKQASEVIATADNYSFKIKTEADTYFATKKEELDNRDGDLSFKERQLNVREDFLRDVKSQLEDKLGKKIDNLVF